MIVFDKNEVTSLFDGLDDLFEVTTSTYLMLLISLTWIKHLQILDIFDPWMLSLGRLWWPPESMDELHEHDLQTNRVVIPLGQL